MVPGIEGFALALSAPAKINLALHVVGQRPDGYHLLESLVTFADRGDRIGLSLSPEDRFTLSGRFATDLSSGSDASENLVLKARDLLRAALHQRGIEVGPVLLHLEKNLPVASGIGGGSADAAATLRGLLQLWSVSVDHETLHGIALKLGADVPMCLHGQPLVAKGIGDEITAVADLPAFPMLIVNPLKDVSTPVIFRMLANKTNPPLLMTGAVSDRAFHDTRDRSGSPPSVGDVDISPSRGESGRKLGALKEKERTLPLRGRCPEGTEGGEHPPTPGRSNVNPAESRSRADWIAHLKTTRNDLEPPARSLEPAIAAVSEAIAREGALFVRMSGSGATCFGLFDTPDNRDRAAANLSSRHPDWYVLACTTVGAEEDGDGRH